MSLLAFALMISLSLMGHLILPLLTLRPCRKHPHQNKLILTPAERATLVSSDGSVELNSMGTALCMETLQNNNTWIISYNMQWTTSVTTADLLYNYLMCLWLYIKTVHYIIMIDKYLLLSCTKHVFPCFGALKPGNIMAHLSSSRHI